MKPFRLTAQAESDLDEIWLFIAEDNPVAADRLSDLLMSKIIALAKQPLMGRSRDDLCSGIRCFPVSNYIILYRETPDFTEIIRIIHGARDIQSLF